MTKIFHILAERDYEKIVGEKLSDFKGVSVANNTVSELFANVFDLGEFKFLNFQLFSQVQVDTLKGAVVSFYGDELLKSIESDTQEIHTSFSRKLNIGLTEFDLDLDDELRNLINDQTIKRIEITFEDDRKVNLIEIHQDKLKLIISEGQSNEIEEVEE